MNHLTVVVFLIVAINIAAIVTLLVAYIKATGRTSAFLSNFAPIKGVVLYRSTLANGEWVPEYLEDDFWDDFESPTEDDFWDDFTCYQGIDYTVGLWDALAGQDDDDLPVMEKMLPPSTWRKTEDGDPRYGHRSEGCDRYKR